VHDPLLLPGDDQSRPSTPRSRAWRVRPAHAKYLFVYPFVKTREWYSLPADERWRIMQEHIKIGREYPVGRFEHELFVRA